MSDKENKKENIDLDEDLNNSDENDSLEDIDDLFDFENETGEETEEDMDPSDDEIEDAFGLGEDELSDDTDDTDDVDEMFVDDTEEEKSDLSTDDEDDFFKSNEGSDLDIEEGDGLDSLSEDDEQGDDSLFDNEVLEVEEDTEEEIDLTDEVPDVDEDDVFGVADESLSEDDSDDDFFGASDEEEVVDEDESLFDNELVGDDEFEDEQKNDEDDIFGKDEEEEDIFGKDEEEEEDIFGEDYQSENENDLINNDDEEEDVFEKEDSPFSQGEDDSPFDDFNEETIEKDEENSNLKENKNKMKEKKGFFGFLGKKKKKDEDGSDASSVDELLGSSKKESVYREEDDVHFAPVVKKGGSTITAVFVSTLFTVSAIGCGVYFGKDYVVNFLFKEKQTELLRLETELKNKVSEVNNALSKNIEVSDSKFLTKEDMELLFTDLNSENIKDMDGLREKLELQMANLNSLSKDLSSNVDKIATLEDGDANHMAMIKDLKGTIDEQRQLIRKTIQITLDVIQQNREIEGRIETSVYDKLSSQVREDMRKQRQELYDFSLIEDRITESLNKNAELARELTSQKQENAKILSELNALKIQYQDLSGDVTKLAEPPKDTGNKVIEELTRNSDNTISIRRSDVEETVKEEPVQPFTKKEEVVEKGLRKVNVIGVLEDRFYVKPEDDGGWQMYKIGDSLEGYGKIIKIENQKIYAEKGIVKTN